MNRDTVIALAREAGLVYCAMDGWTSPTPENKYPEGVEQEPLERFAALVAAHERNKIAAWTIDRGYATGHGDTTEDLLKELEWQIKERERRRICNMLLDMHAKEERHNNFLFIANIIKESA